MIKRRGKLGLINVNCSYSSARDWIREKMENPFKIGNTEGYLKRFIIEPFVEHTDEQELYCAIYGTNTGIGP